MLDVALLCGSTSMEDCAKTKKHLILKRCAQTKSTAMEDCAKTRTDAAKRCINRSRGGSRQGTVRCFNCAHRF